MRALELKRRRHVDVMQRVCRGGEVGGNMAARALLFPLSRQTVDILGGDTELGLWPD